MFLKNCTKSKKLQGQTYHVLHSLPKSATPTSKRIDFTSSELETMSLPEFRQFHATQRVLYTDQLTRKDTLERTSQNEFLDTTIRLKALTELSALMPVFNELEKKYFKNLQVLLSRSAGMTNQPLSFFGDAEKTEILVKQIAEDNAQNAMKLE
jgi:hypothetical protein